MFIVNNRKLFFTISVALFIGSIFSVYKYGFNLGIDFKGGTVLEVAYPSAELRPALDTVKSGVEKIDIGGFTVTPSGQTNYILKTRDITPAQKTQIMSVLSGNGSLQVVEKRFNSVGPVVGNELKNKAAFAIAIVIVCILLFITFVFRKVSLPVASWKYGMVTIIALLHDVVIPTGIFVAWIHYRGGEIDLLFVTALLAILGYSVHDTIVVFDRIRENLRTNNRRPFIEVVGESVSQTIGRSINTSLTTFLSLLALYFFGGDSTKDFAFILLVGIIIGTYSSIFVASPLLVTLERMQK
jgi:preprotein translocase subunit SecF